MLLRCTNRLLKLVGEHPEPSDPGRSDDDWYANLIWIDRRKCLLLMHAGTRFPVVATDVRTPDLRPLTSFCVRLIAKALSDERLPRTSLGPLDPSEARIARTADRSVLGTMNRVVEEWRWLAQGAVGAIPDEVVNHQLHRTIVSIDGSYREPLELATERGRMAR
jgi:hypothetical protein